jgi:hypothetical protein
MGSICDENSLAQGSVFGTNLKDPFLNMQKSIGESTEVMRSKKFNTGKLHAKGRRQIFQSPNNHIKVPVSMVDEQFGSVSSPLDSFSTSPRQ